MYLVVRGIKRGEKGGEKKNWDKGDGVENYCNTLKQRESLN